MCEVQFRSEQASLLLGQDETVTEQEWNQNQISTESYIKNSFINMPFTNHSQDIENVNKVGQNHFIPNTSQSW